MNPMQYIDFDVLIESGKDGYRIRVLNSPAGQATHEFTLPFNDLELENFMLLMGRARRGVRSSNSPQLDTARKFGGKLYKAIFDDAVQACYRSSLDEAVQKQAGLRLRLRLDAPELANLPWEYLFDPGLNNFLSLSPETPIVRYLDLPERIRPLQIQPPLRVLTMISSPADSEPLDVEHEWQNLLDATAEQRASNRMVLERLERASLDALLNRLQKQEYHIFHFIGHGGFQEKAGDGTLTFEDERGRGRAVSGLEIGTVLRPFRSLRMAILNACEGARTAADDPFAGVAQSLVQKGIPAVIAMQFEVSDEAAIQFAHALYAAISEGAPVDTALARARLNLFARGNPIEWGTPVLYMRAPDGRIFDVPAQGTSTDLNSVHRPGWLEGLRGSLAGRKLELDKPAQVFGREAGNDVQVPDGRISRQHARIQRAADGYIIEDLGSTNGTFINGARLRKPQALQPGDEIALGDSLFVFRQAPAPGAAPRAVKDTDRHAAVKDQPAAQPASSAPTPLPGSLPPITLPPVSAAPAAPDYTLEIASFLGQARQALAAGELAAAETALGQVLRRVPAHPEAQELVNQLRQRQQEARVSTLLGQAGAALERNDLQQAAQLCRQALALQPGQAAALSILAQAEETQRQQRLATLYNEAQAALSRSDWQTAVPKLEAVLQLEPGHAPAQAQLAQARHNLEEHSLVSFYQQAVGHYKAGRRRLAYDCLLQVRRLRAGYQDSDELISRLERELNIKPAFTPPATGGLPPAAPEAGAAGGFGQPQPGETEPAQDPGRLYNLPLANLDQLAEAVRYHLMVQGYENQVVRQGEQAIVQGRKGGWRSLVGMGVAASVMIEQTPEGLNVKIGGGKWLEQGAAIAVSMFVLWPLLLTGGAGMIMQKNLNDELWRVVEAQITQAGGQRIR